MRELKLHSPSGLTALFAGYFCLSAPTPQHTRLAVDCNSGSTIGQALSRARAGDILLVTGTCRESVTIPAPLVNITLDGKGKATIQHPGGKQPPGAGSHVIYIRGTGITIRGFSITGGVDGVHLSGPAHAVIEGNMITGNTMRGIHLDKGSVAQIVDNLIADNGGAGINVTENSYARIGFLIPPDRKARANTIRGNGHDGIQVQRASSAWIVGNTIAGNHGTGIVVDRGSEADVIGNTINDNSGDAISASRNSGVNLRSDGTPRSEGPNQTDPGRRNRGVAIRCSIGGYVHGPLGTLAGTEGARKFGGSCVDQVVLR